MCLREMSPELKPTRDLVENDTSSQGDAIPERANENTSPSSEKPADAAEECNESDELTNGDIRVDSKARRGTLDAIKWSAGQCHDQDEPSLEAQCEESST